jgi:hypothetical protein
VIETFTSHVKLYSLYKLENKQLAIR